MGTETILPAPMSWSRREPVATSLRKLTYRKIFVLRWISGRARITSYNVCYTKLLRVKSAYSMLVWEKMALVKSQFVKTDFDRFDSEKSTSCRIVSVKVMFFKSTLKNDEWFKMQFRKVTDNSRSLQLLNCKPSILESMNLTLLNIVLFKTAMQRLQSWNSQSMKFIP